MTSRLLSQSVWMLLLTTLAAGCADDRAVDAEQASARAAQRRMRQSNALLESIVSQLGRLPEATQLELRPPTVLLDARSSADGEDVMAVIRRRPDAAPEEPFNLLEATTDNARFKTLGVRPGDIVKYYAQYDRETMDRIREAGDAGIVSMAAIDLEVAQVLDNDTLLFTEGMWINPNVEPTAYRLEVWRNVDTRMEAIDERLGRYLRRRDPPLHWQPSGDEVALNQMTERLNQWFRQGVADAPDWAPPKLLSTLGADLLNNETLAPYLGLEALAEGGFLPHETRLLQEATWLRGVGTWARGDSLERIDQGAALFDWVTRNLMLIADDQAAPHFVWEILLYGRATASQRAWVFAELCRHQGLDAGVLLIPVEEGERVLSVVLIDGALHVFDPALGMPLPGKEGESVATFAELREDDALLRALDLPDATYPLSADSFADARLAVVAGPFSLSRRAAELSDRLSGKDTLALAADVDALAERLSEASSAEIVLWDAPVRVFLDKLTTDPSTRAAEVKAFLPYAWRPALWKSRGLHFRGTYEEPSRNTQNALAQVIDDHRDAMQLYMDPTVRPNDRRLEAVGSEIKREIYASAKAAATYWLGAIAYEREDYRNALSWLNNQTLDGGAATGYAEGVRYWRARTHEAIGEFSEAAALLRQSQSPQKHGDLLRARMLETQAEPREGQAP